MALYSRARRYPILGGVGLGLLDDDRTPFDEPPPNFVSREFTDFKSDVAPRRRKSRPKRKKGRPVRCKLVAIKVKDGKCVKRKLCWDKHGTLVSNKPARGGKASKKKGRKKSSGRRCPRGTHRVGAVCRRKG